jgi:hypothetical protein
MTNLESVVQVAFEMRGAGEMTEEVYAVFNDTIAQLEYLARDLLEDSHE